MSEYTEQPVQAGVNDSNDNQSEGYFYDGWQFLPKDLVFECSKCGEVLSMGESKVRTRESSIPFSFEVFGEEIWGGEVHDDGEESTCYQCFECWEVIKTEDGNNITDYRTLLKWLEQQPYNLDPIEKQRVLAKYNFKNACRRLNQAQYFLEKYGEIDTERGVLELRQEHSEHGREYNAALDEYKSCEERLVSLESGSQKSQGKVNHVQAV